MARAPLTGDGKAGAAPGQILELLSAVGEIGVRRASLQGFGEAFTPDTGLRVLGQAQAGVLERLIEAQLLRARSSLLEREGRIGDALAVAETVVARTEDLGFPPLQVVALTQAGSLLRRQAKLAPAQERLVRALDLAGTSGTTVANAWIRYEMGYLAYMRADFAGASSAFQSSIEAAQDEEDTVGQVAGLGMLAHQLYINGDNESAAAKIEAAMAQIERMGDGMEPDWTDRWRTNLLLHRSSILRLSGRLDEAESDLQRAAKKARYGDIFASESGAAKRGQLKAELAVSRGDFEAALLQLTSELRILRDIGFTESSSEVFSLLGRVYLARGEEEKAHEQFDLALGLPAEFANQRGHAWAHFELARWELRLGRKEQAAQHLETALEATATHYAPEHLTALELLKSLG
jgi:tetratricopeptide (TPR) repeat protein